MVKDLIFMNEDFVFDSIDLIVSNSNYQPEYLKRIYVVEFYRILRKIEQKLKQKTNGRNS